MRRNPFEVIPNAWHSLYPQDFDYNDIIAIMTENLPWQA